MHARVGEGIDHEGPWHAGVGLGYLLRYGEARWRDFLIEMVGAL